MIQLGLTPNINLVCSVFAVVRRDIIVQKGPATNG